MDLADNQAHRQNVYRIATPCDPAQVRMDAGDQNQEGPLAHSPSCAGECGSYLWDTLTIQSSKQVASAHRQKRGARASTWSRARKRAHHKQVVFSPQQDNRHTRPSGTDAERDALQVIGQQRSKPRRVLAKPLTAHNVPPSKVHGT